MKRGLFLTVNYFQAAMTIELIKSLLAISGVEHFRIVVVDNSASSEEYEQLLNFKKLTEGDVEILKTPSNLGYFGAVNFALKHPGNSKGYDYVIVSNNDIEIRDRQFFQNLLELQSDAQVIAPDIISLTTGRHQNPHRTSPVSRFQKFQYRLLYSNYYFGLILYHARKLIKSTTARHHRMAKPAKQAIFSAYGAFFIFHRSYFEMGGTIDYGYFLYGEEDSVAAQCAENGMKIALLPDFEVFHNEHISTDSTGFKKNIYQLQQKAYRYIKANYLNFY
ncbi:MAG TPA: glycosyltransferase [Bacteroidales bacterium]|jgi:GT2 family glycosyltransferase|nr:glycosyltransferase family 2 protein [Bacteroidales bacterium]HPB24151.1 glycosyltransferase [Bacteroidales bacterium]HPI29559.1 glycosyltransferase [Bacteroidales bacterium]HQN14748.1 glycosyltransferase [Bacteroidales bacterium]HQP14442.1 glycosyltransferase [Bacteroidales bacterium]